MRLLALSDLHDNPRAARLLRDREPARFDAVVVAGDMGSETACETLTVLAGFGCPVLYVYGNWDRRLPYDASLVPGCDHLHLRVIDLGALAFTGYSGCAAHWGLNPIGAALRAEVRDRHRAVVDRCEAVRATHAAATGRKRDRRSSKVRAVEAALEDLRGTEEYKRYRADVRAADARIRDESLRAMAAAVRDAGVPGDRVAAVAHERVPRVAEAIPGLKLHLFGHLHCFSDTTHLGTRFVNVSVLDWSRVIATDPANMRDVGGPWEASYVVIEVGRDGRVGVESRRLASAPERGGG